MFTLLIVLTLIMIIIISISKKKKEIISNQNNNTYKVEPGQDLLYHLAYRYFNGLFGIIRASKQWKEGVISDIEYEQASQLVDTLYIVVVEAHYVYEKAIDYKIRKDNSYVYYEKSSENFITNYIKQKDYTGELTEFHKLVVKKNRNNLNLLNKNKPIFVDA